MKHSIRKSRRFSSRKASALTHWLYALSLAPTLIASAVLMAVSLGRPGQAWLAWVSLIPLLAAVRKLSPLPAALAGAGWGLCLYTAATAGLAPNLDPSILSLALLAIIPAAYTALGSLATRALGFAPIILSLLWILAEIALQPLGLRSGLLASTQGSEGVAEYLAGLLGYIFVASAIIYGNAWLLNLLVELRIDLSFAPLRQFYVAPRPRSVAPIVCRPQLSCHFRGRPRAPPSF